MYDEQGKKFSAEMIYNQLKNLANETKAETLIGHLTGDERQLWAPIYNQLASGKSIEKEVSNHSLKCFFSVPENRNLFDTIHDSVLVLCLDDAHSSSSEKKDPQTAVGLNVLHGNGTKNNTANRWFDKTLQVDFLVVFWSIISKNVLVDRWI